VHIAYGNEHFPGGGYIFYPEGKGQIPLINDLHQAGIVTVDPDGFKMPALYFHKCPENISFVKNKSMNFASEIYNGKTEIKNIIFDWGGVITDLHLDSTRNAFLELGLTIFDESVPHDPHNDLFIPFEIGKISPDVFRNRIRSYSSKPISDNDIDEAWNALLGDLPAERWRILEKAAGQFRTFLLSNTNAIHRPYYYGLIKKKYGTNGYAHLFEKTYFSYELGMRKPNPDIFRYVLKDAGIDPAETLFIDDFIENVQTAHLLGFQTVHLKAPLTLTDVFTDPG
jgi:putative hydrolase of the HAD superfamily